MFVRVRRVYSPEVMLMDMGVTVDGEVMTVGELVDRYRELKKGYREFATPGVQKALEAMIEMLDGERSSVTELTAQVVVKKAADDTEVASEQFAFKFMAETPVSEIVDLMDAVHKRQVERALWECEKFGVEGF